MLGTRADIDDIARAFEKVYEHRDAADVAGRAARLRTAAAARFTRSSRGSCRSLAALTDNRLSRRRRAGMVAVVPLTIVGGLFTILSHLPFASWDARRAAPAAAARCRSPRRSACWRVVASFSIAYDLGKRLRQEAIVSAR